MKVLMFKEEFIHLIRDDHKLQTVCPMPKRMIYPGTALSLRYWLGKPYRSKQAVIRAATLIDHALFEITRSDRFYLNGRCLLYSEMDQFAVADGFNNAHEMLAWFRNMHGWDHFKGVAYLWSPSWMVNPQIKPQNSLLVSYGRELQNRMV